MYWQGSLLVLYLNSHGIGFPLLNVLATRKGHICSLLANPCCHSVVIIIVIVLLLLNKMYFATITAAQKTSSTTALVDIGQLRV